MPRIEVVVAGPSEYLDEVSQIWAEATAVRDGHCEIASLDAARAVIEAVVNSSAQSLLLVALSQDNDALGFAAALPVGTAHDRRAELRYLGVRPQAWGGGIAVRLLAALREALRSRGFVEAELWVYRDNRRAIDLYRRMEWQTSSDVRIHPRSGQREQRYTQTIASESPLAHS